MPPVNQAVFASAGIIVASVAVAAAIALYESPEVRRVAEDLRRRIAVALHSLGDNLDPSLREPRFNRPEDAEGFLQSRGSLGADEGVDADDETRRRQREELMYWNARREEMQGQKRRESEQAANPDASPSQRALTFDDFLKEDNTAERGTFVYNTGASRWGEDQQQGIRRRGIEGVRGLSASMIANPFSDEYGIELNEHPGSQERHALSPGHDEAMSDIYDATPLDGRSVVSQTLSPQSKPAVPEVLFDFDSQARSQSGTADSATVDGDNYATPAASTRSGDATGQELGDDEYMTAGKDDGERDAYASIQAWAQGSHPFYSPLPETPVAPISEPELISQGQLTPAYSASVASGVDVAHEVLSSKGGDFDIVSDDEEDDGIRTPNSWSEVGSMVSETGSVHA